METTNVKQEARQILDRLPETVSWKDLAYEFYVREQIEAGLAASAAGRKRSMEEVFAKYGIGDES